MMEVLFRTHKYLLEHTHAPVRRALMDEINWRDRLIGIKGSRGVGKTTFLLQYAKERFGVRDRRCLYINMNNFCFQGKSLYEFAREFAAAGGTTLLIDQVFKQEDWSHQLRMIYDNCSRLHVVFTGSSVMRLKEENPELNGIAHSYNLRGFSFREYLNLQLGLNLRPYTLREILNRHEHIADEVMAQVDPLAHFSSYLHHGYYPFFLEKTNFSENLLKVMNMMIEVDILLIKQIEQKYLSRIKKLFYMLAVGDTGTPNVSQLSVDSLISRATVMNYIKYLCDARLINIVYRHGDTFPKKPGRVLLHNTNLMYAMTPGNVNEQNMIETFFQNALWGRHDVRTGDRSSTFMVDGEYRFRVCQGLPMRRSNGAVYACHGMDKGVDRQIPLWIFGFLY